MGVPFEARLRWLCAVAGLAATLLLSGCTPGDTAHNLPSKADTQLHPIGDPGLWFDNDYGLGVSTEYSTPNTVCGITNGVIVEVEKVRGNNSRVTARDLPGRQIAWEINDSSCSPGSTMDGAVVVSTRGTKAGENTRDLVNVATGDVQQNIQLESRSSSARQISQVNGLRILLIGQDLLVGLDENGIVWKQTELQAADLTPLGDGHIGLSNGLEGWLSIIDGRTGEATLPRTNLDVHDTRWASDGYVLNVNESDPEYAFFDLQGNETDRTVGESQLGFVPYPSRGLTFPLKDHINAGTVTAVDVTGVPAVFSSDTGHRIFLRGGKLDESQINNLLWPQAVSADGSLVLAYSDGEGFAIYDVHGEAIASWPLADALRVEDGYITYTTEHSTQVLIPGH